MAPSEDHSMNPTNQSSRHRKSKTKRFSQVFWLAFLVVSLVYAWYSFYVPANEVKWVDSISSAKKMSAETEKPILLFFTADWCVPCRIMKREVFADKDIAQVINKTLIPLMIYANEAGSDELFEQYNVGGTPVTIIINEKGDVFDYAVGGIGKNEFLHLINNLKLESSQI